MGCNILEKERQGGMGKQNGRNSNVWHGCTLESFQVIPNASWNKQNQLFPRPAPPPSPLIQEQQLMCFIHKNLAFIHRVAKRAQSSDPFPPQASQRLQVFGAWLLSYLGATYLLIRRRSRSYSQWFSWLWRKSAREQLTELLISGREIFFLILLGAFFFWKRKAFWRSCTSSKPPYWRSESFFPKQKCQKYKTQQVTPNLWRVM